MQHEPIAPLPIGPRVRVMLVAEAAPLYPQRIHGAKDVFDLLQAEVSRFDRERFLVVLLDGMNAVIGLDEVHVGELASCPIHPREIFKAAILANAKAFICVHNHPSGDPTPSTNDCAATARLKELADLLAIKLLDHIILAGDRYYSFAEEGKL